MSAPSIKKLTLSVLSLIMRTKQLPCVDMVPILYFADLLQSKPWHTFISKKKASVFSSKPRSVPESGADKDMAWFNLNIPQMLAVIPESNFFYRTE